MDIASIDLTLEKPKSVSFLCRKAEPLEGLQIYKGRVMWEFLYMVSVNCVSYIIYRRSWVVQ
jgi:hypothetical protein